MRALAHSLAAVSACAAAPLFAAALVVRPSWRVGVRERLGAPEPVAPGAVWIHGASVGEILAAARLVDRLRKAGHEVVTSTFTTSGRAVMRRARPEVPCLLAPLDHPWCVAGAHARVRPAALVLIETELWPSWFAAARRRGIPVAMISARVSDRSFPRYRRLGRLVKATLAKLDAVGARTEVDAERWIALGADPARVTVTGDLKIELDERPRALAPELERVLARPHLFVAGSTRGGEEIAVLHALREIERAGVPAALVLAPRQPDRAAEVEALVRRAGRPLRRRAALGEAPLADGEVLVLDTVGELEPVYARAVVAFVGGSLVPHGGHNPVEPVFAGRPVVYGRHTTNVRHAVEILEHSGAGRRVEDASELGAAVADWMCDPARAREAGAAGRAALLRHRGSAERAAALVERLLAARGPGDSAHPGAPRA